MAFDIRVQNVLEKNPDLTDHGVATGVTKFRMASGGLKKGRIFSPELFKNLRSSGTGFWVKTIKLIFL